jgi:hypothetical protein
MPVFDVKPPKENVEGLSEFRDLTIVPTNHRLHRLATLDTFDLKGAKIMICTESVQDA